MGTLSKTIKRSFIPGENGVPATPGVPSTPARWVTQTSIVCTFSRDAPPEIPGVVLPWSNNCSTYETQVYIPASPGSPAIPGAPGRPARIVLGYQLGWNSRAAGQYALQHSGIFTFTVPGSAIGVVIGATGSPQSSGFADIMYAFSVTSGELKVMELGMAVLSLGRQPGAVLAIERVNGQINYYVDDALVRTVPATGDPLVLSAAMYSGGDSVIDAQLDEYESVSYGSVSMLPPVAGGGGDAYCFGSAVSAPMTAEGISPSTSSGAASFLPMLAIGGEAYCGGAAVSSPMEAIGDSYGVLPYCIGDLYMAAPEAWGLSLTGSLSGGELSFPPMEALGSDGPYTFGTAVLRPPFAWGATPFEPGKDVLLARTQFTAAVAPIGTAHLVMRADMSVAGLLVVRSRRRVEIESHIEAETAFIAKQFASVVLKSLMDAGTVLGGDDEISVWALSIENNGMTRYENYGFESFAIIGGQAYGAKPDGIYLLEGNTDDGAAIAGRINFGRKNFGTLSRKALPEVYVGMAADGQSVLKIGADGGEYFYTIRDHTLEHKAHRFELGRGLRASYYDVELQNAGGAAFDMSEIDFKPVELKRTL